ncbi:hypothetical protein PTKIN_Ptkin08bG0066600 [Pterospermum kingtungense]
MEVNDLVFLVDFYVLDIGNNNENTHILLERPFLKTSKTKKDVYSGTLTTEFDGKTIKFNIYDDMKYMCDDNPIYSINVIDSFSQDVFELDGKDELEVATSKHVEKKDDALMLSADLQETIAKVDDALTLQHSGEVTYIALPVFDEKLLPFLL